MTWGKMIDALQLAGVTLERISEELGISTRMVCYLKATDCDPRYSTGERLKALYEKHVPQETSQSIS
jgi:hypothetical protein